MENATLMEERKNGLPIEDAIVLQQYAMWHPKVLAIAQERVICGKCSHCSPPKESQNPDPSKPQEKPAPEKPQETKSAELLNVLRSLHGECHCHPCGSLIPEVTGERQS